MLLMGVVLVELVARGGYDNVVVFVGLLPRVDVFKDPIGVVCLLLLLLPPLACGSSD